VPLFVDNDCNLFTLGIHRVELKGKPDTMAGAFLGTGFGGGLIINGRLFRGHNFAAGEFGQITIDKNGLKTAHSFRGSLESLASRTGIVRALRKAVLEGEETMLQDELGPHLTGVRSRHLRIALAERDPLVKRIVKQAAEDTGIGIAAIISAFGPEYVMLNGGVIEALQKPMLPVIRKTAAAHVLPGTMAGIKIEASKLGDDGGIHGAAILANEEEAKARR
jgi:glucokinase